MTYAYVPRVYPYVRSFVSVCLYVDMFTRSFSLPLYYHCFPPSRVTHVIIPVCPLCRPQMRCPTRVHLSSCCDRSITFALIQGLFDRNLKPLSFCFLPSVLCRICSLFVETLLVAVPCAFMHFCALWGMRTNVCSLLCKCTCKWLQLQFSRKYVW